MILHGKDWLYICIVESSEVVRVYPWDSEPRSVRLRIMNVRDFMFSFQREVVRKLADSTCKRDFFSLFSATTDFSFFLRPGKYSYIQTLF